MLSYQADIEKTIQSKFKHLQRNFEKFLLSIDFFESKICNSVYVF